MLSDSAMTLEQLREQSPLPSIRIAHHLEHVVRNGLTDSYRKLIASPSLQWPIEYRVECTLGAGAQGVVYLADRSGVPGIPFPVALKLFSPERYSSADDYCRDMDRISRIASRVASVQQDHLLDIYNAVDCGGIRIMAMEWVDGFDLNYLLDPATLETTRRRADETGWAHLTQVVLAAGPHQTRLKPGIANAIVRQCLAALAALHREGIIHADIKPSNIMVKRTGNVRIIDLGSAFTPDEQDLARVLTPRYAAPEVLRGESMTPGSDLASLGYVLIEILSGIPLFSGLKNASDLLTARDRLGDRLHEYLPDEIMQSRILVRLIRGLIAANPRDRFPSAEAADLFEDGAASFGRELVTGNLASEYGSELQNWLHLVTRPEPCGISLPNRSVDARRMR